MLTRLALNLHRRGRLPIGATYEERIRHIRCAYKVGKGICSEAAVALDEGVTVQTVKRWCKLALTYDDIEAEGLRRELGISEVAYDRQEGGCV